MIGFSPDLTQDLPKSEEGSDTVNLSKHALYNIVEDKYVIPAFISKGVTRDYLLKVYKDEVWRIEVNVMKRFEFDLTSSQNKKVGIINNSYVMRKLNILMQEKQMKPLGFDEFELPEQTWLFRVARFIDKENLLELFETHITLPPTLSQASPDIMKIYHGRLYASQYFFKKKEAKSNKKLWENLKTISDSYRALCSAKITLEVLEREINDTKDRQVRLAQQLEDQISKTAVSYTTMDNPQLRHEMLIKGQALPQDLQENLYNNARL